MIFPVMLEMSRAHIWCVGAGSIATAKVVPMIEAGASVTVIAPVCNEELARAARTIVQRNYQQGDISISPQPELVIAATNDIAVNDMVAQDAAKLGLWCLRADTPGDLMLPARVPVPGITVAVSTGVPALTSKLSMVLANQLDGRWAAAASILDGLRTDTTIRAKMAAFPQHHRRIHWKMATAAVLDGESDRDVLEDLLTTSLPHDNCSEDSLPTH